MESQDKIWDKEYSDNQIKWHRETELPPLLRNMRVLELGVGNGKTLKGILKQNPASVTAVDFSEKAIEICEKEFPSVKFIKADTTKIPLGDKFDVIVCYYLLNNMLEKKRKETVAEILRLLEKKGIVLFEDFAKEDLRWNVGKKLETGSFVNQKGILMHFFTKNEISRLFSDFSKVEVEEREFSPIKMDETKKRRIVSGIIVK